MTDNDFGRGENERNSYGSRGQDNTNYHDSRRSGYSDNYRGGTEKWVHGAADAASDAVRWAADTVADAVHMAADTVTDAANKMRSVSSIVDDAVRDGDYSGLGKDVKRAVYGKPRSGQNKEENGLNINDYFEPEKGDTLQRLLAIVFGLGFIFWALFAVVALLLSIPEGLFASYFAVVLVFAVLAALSAWGYKAEKNKSEERWRYKRYRDTLYPRLYCEVPELAKKVNKPTDFTVKDLERMTKKGWIKQGNFDDRKKYFIASEEIYRQYRNATRGERERKNEEARRAFEREAVSPEVRKLINDGNAYADRLLEASSKIKDSEVASDVITMENVIREIIEEVEKRPSLASGLGTFSQYYLPTSVKLVDAYVEMDEQPIQGENIIKSKKEIADALDTINAAYASLLDSFFKDQSVDVTSDINVMKAMMKQDGLTPDDLTLSREKNRRKNEKSENEPKNKVLTFGGGAEDEQDS